VCGRGGQQEQGYRCVGEVGNKSKGTGVWERWATRAREQVCGRGGQQEQGYRCVEEVGNTSKGIGVRAREREREKQTVAPSKPKTKTPPSGAHNTFSLFPLKPASRQAAFERRFGVRAAAAEAAARRLTGPPQWQRLFLQRAVIAHAHVGTLDDDDDGDGASPAAVPALTGAAPRAAVRSLADALACLDSGHRPPTPIPAGSRLVVYATGPPNRRTAALAALKAAAHAHAKADADDGDDAAPTEAREPCEEARAEAGGDVVSCAFPLPRLEGARGAAESAVVQIIVEEARADGAGCEKDAPWIAGAAAVLLASGETTFVGRCRAVGASCC